jgi:type II secretory pathway predicted ATPase ExeA
MYLEFYGLRARPFTLLPDPSMLYWSKAHEQAFAMMEYGVLNCAPITLITGEIGAGKTTLIRHLLDQLDNDYAVGLISNAHGDRGELLHWVLTSLGQPVEDTRSYVRLFREFQEFLIERYAEGKRTVLIFDEAQNLEMETLEELRMFSNINADSDYLLQLILVGQPELCEKIAQPELVQFAQRVASQFHIPRLSKPETQDYIHHRLEAVGGDTRLFKPKSMDLIHQTTGGAPRLINMICDLALTVGFSKELAKIGPNVIRQIVPHMTRYGAFKSLEPKQPQPTKDRPHLRIASTSPN